MLYYIFRFLEQFGTSGSHLWSYISFRALLALILSLIISAWFGEKFIKYMKRKNLTEVQRSADIDPFGVNKIGVPSMGGIIIIVAILVPALLLGRLRNIYLIIMIVTTVWLGFLGFMDDYIKNYKHNKEGLPGKFKIVGQVSIGLIVGLILWASPDAKINENVSVSKTTTVTQVVNTIDEDKEPVGNEIVIHKSEPVKSLKTTIPFFKNNNLDYEEMFSFMGDYASAAAWVFFVLLTIFIVTAVSNGANLNDGMDGMCAGNSAIIGVALGILAYVSSHIEYASYLDIMYIPGSQELVVFLCAFIGALIGFLWYNAYPAQVFMGDTGSLTIGGIIGVTAVIIHKELLLPILCGIFFVESLSVILQVWYAKTGTKKGIKRRMFKRTPIHDAFRTPQTKLDPEIKYLFNTPKGAWHESKVTFRFWITTLILAAITIITLKIR
ncbi:MAG: phospho-N-acetylmuramoyl-pentapeptide-transferase [Bacteroidaceae bacterium]|nr:phospho-N-acetylmuramoyl-pentapeptide-transferase [Bacteroidaceae bacterium]